MAMPIPSAGRWLDEARSLLASNPGADVRTFVDKGVTQQLVPPNYLRPIDDELDELLHLGNRYPGFVRSEQIGTSVEGRPIVAVHMTNFADPRPKPLLGIQGTTHGDEVGNGAFGMSAIHHTLADQATQVGPRAILDAREVRVIPYVNPDGRAYAERGYVTGDMGDLMHRDNARGVDLNRNFPVGWGTTKARRGSAGSGPASEPETQAVMAYWQQHRPNVFFDVHSAGERILLPARASRADVRYAQTMATRNDYTVEDPAKFTAGGTSGTAKDWVHETLHVPSYTLETGSTHHMSDADLAASVLRNTRALSWVLRSADDPIARSRGPEVRVAQLAANGPIVAEAVRDGLRHPVAGMEVTSDPLAAAGSGARMVLASPRADATTTQWALDPQATARLQSEAGTGLLYTRAIDDHGNWGPFQAVGAAPL